MNQLATELNKVLCNSSADRLLSDYGKRLYVPKGIIVQSGEAKKKAHKFNATIGIATEHGEPMFIPSMRAMFSDELKLSQIFPYSPMGGNLQLREKWLSDMREKNPLMKDKKVSLPLVASGLTSAVSIVASLFLDRGDAVILPDMYWENYNLILTEQCQASIIPYKFFVDEKFNTEGLSSAIDSANSDKVFVFMNFPNNPTGYSPTEEEAEKITEILIEKARNGKKILVLSDDAYFGLFFDEHVCRQSLFARLCDAHENILAVKCDGATKEEMAWGFRVGFITYGCKGFDDEMYNAIMQKTMGAIRGTLSSCSTSSQNILLEGMSAPDYKEGKAVGVAKIEKRLHCMKNELEKYKAETYLVPLPFNSGYFMSFYCDCNAEDLRQLLLDKYEAGVIRLDEHHIRLAFSSIDLEKIPELIKVVYQAAKELS